MNQRIQTFSRGMSQYIRIQRRNILFPDDLSANRIVNIVINIRYFIRKADNLSFHGSRHSFRLVIQNTVPHFLGQIQPSALLFQTFHYADALLAVFKSVRTNSGKRPLPGMSEGRMSQIVAQCNGLCQILIETQRLRYGSGVLGNLQGMGQTIAIMVSFRCQKHLGLTL